MENQYLALYLFHNELITFLKTMKCTFTSDLYGYHFHLSSSIRTSPNSKTGFDNSKQTSKVFYCFQQSLVFQTKTQTTFQKLKDQILRTFLLSVAKFVRPFYTLNISVHFGGINSLTNDKKNLFLFFNQTK